MSGFIVPPRGQQLQPVIRRIVTLAKQHGENVDIDKNMPSMRLKVGPKTLEAWHESNKLRHARDAKAAAGVVEAAAQRKRERDNTAAAADPVPEVKAEPAPKKAASKQQTRKRKPAAKQQNPKREG